MALDFEAGPSRSLEALCRELAPELDELPLKRPLRPADVPLPDRDSPRFRPPPPRPPADKPGRNDPCWCGSGKKYKRCHLREDEEQERRYRRWLLGQE
ncbi:MAG: SEC-C domain-containing protein [Chloroflexia bacterium]|nr:SEC-C domain-containing protein [Chloroflexia bacterium]